MNNSPEDYTNPLEFLFRRQADLMRRLGTPTSCEHTAKLYDLQYTSDPQDHMFWIEKSGDKILMEGSEIKDWTPWKHWSRKSGNKEVEPGDLGSPGHMAEIKMEFIDVLHFNIEGMIIMGITHETVIEEYCRKNDINHARQDSGKY